MGNTNSEDELREKRQRIGDYPPSSKSTGVAASSPDAAPQPKGIGSNYLEFPASELGTILAPSVGPRGNVDTPNNANCLKTSVNT
jgi:predicted alpha/beta superfamily hydrolase